MLFWKSWNVYIWLYRYKCTKLPRQNMYPCRSPRLATWAAHAAVKFGDEEQSTNKNKQIVPNEESENAEGLPSKLLFIWPFVKILCMSSESSKTGSIFCVHLLSKQFELHSFRPIRGCRVTRRRWFWSLLEDNCKACTPRTALAHPMILQNAHKTESYDSGILCWASTRVNRPKRSQNCCCTKLRNSCANLSWLSHCTKCKKKIGHFGRGTRHVICQSACPYFFGWHPWRFRTALMMFS